MGIFVSRLPTTDLGPRSTYVIRELHLENFRALREFGMTGLGRVNLLVGTNNCGKTSVLEAIHVLAAPGTPGPLWNALARRGEIRDDSDEREVDVAHIVHGHEIEVGGYFSVSGKNDDDERSVRATFIERDPQQLLQQKWRSSRQRSLFEADPDDEASLGSIDLSLEWNSPDQSPKLQWPLTRRGALLREVLPASSRQVIDGASPVQFITTEGLTRDHVVALFEATVLTPDETMVVEALRTIEPEIERLASVGSSRRYGYGFGSRGGIAMLVGGKRVPIGSMGDGVWRLLGIALSLVRAERGILLIDEIDTGLHYSVLVDMWRLVYETAKRLEVQIFATTHSRDCYEALASVAEAGRYDISLQRIERGKPLAIAFSEAEIVQAAERGIEVR